MPTDNIPIWTNPRNPAHVRAVLARLRETFLNIETDLGEIEGVVIREGVSGAAIAEGDVVRASANDTIVPAQANSDTNSKVIGIAVTSAPGAGSDVLFIPGGAVESSAFALTFNTEYFLSPTTPGDLTSTAPTTAGQYVVSLGFALSSDTLVLNIGPRILL